MKKRSALLAELEGKALATAGRFAHQLEVVQVEAGPLRGEWQCAERVEAVVLAADELARLSIELRCFARFYHQVEAELARDAERMRLRKEAELEERARKVLAEQKELHDRRKGLV